MITQILLKKTLCLLKHKSILEMSLTLETPIIFVINWFY